jgi:hypothetical protein
MGGFEISKLKSKFISKQINTNLPVWTLTAKRMNESDAFIIYTCKGSNRGVMKDNSQVFQFFDNSTYVYIRIT